MRKTLTEQHYEIRPDVVVSLDDFPKVNPDDLTRHRHVAILLEGREIWLDIGTENSDHDFIDIRQFNSGGKMQGQGVFTIVNGRRSSLSHELIDAEGKPVTGHGWSGGYVMTLLTDKDGAEKATADPASSGNG